MFYIEDLNKMIINYSGVIRLESEDMMFISGERKHQCSLSEFMVESFYFSKKDHFVNIKLHRHIELKPICFSGEEIETVIICVNVKYCLYNRRVLVLEFDRDCKKEIEVSLYNFNFSMDF